MLNIKLPMNNIYDAGESGSEPTTRPETADLAAPVYVNNDKEIITTTPKLVADPSVVAHEGVGVVIVAAGRSTRMAGLDKQFALAGGRPLLAHTVGVFERSPLVSEIVLVLNADNLLRGRALAYEEGWQKVQKIVIGGSRRQDSVWNGLQAFEKKPPTWILIHDGARPFVTEKIIEDGLRTVQEHGASVVGVPVKDTIKLVSSNDLLVEQTPPRDLLWAVQTPQFFNYELVCEAHREAINQQLDVTDDASLLEKLGRPVKIFEGNYTNIKITTPDDLALAQRIFAENATVKYSSRSAEIKAARNDANLSQIRVGHGYDVHRLTVGRLLILGGLEIPFEFGLDGHSDADVLTHAVINALLGAAGLGDIGRYFPPTDPTYKGIPSLKMLSQVHTLLCERGWRILNIDATVAAQRPKLSSYTFKMRQNLAETLQIEVDQVNLKAVTTEQLGFVGREEGLEAQAAALLARRSQ